jgi:hypothetical protein
LGRKAQFIGLASTKWASAGEIIVTLPNVRHEHAGHVTIALSDRSEELLAILGVVVF